MSRATIYIVSDGKPGHLNQCRGLASAMDRIAPSRVIELPATAKHTSPEPQRETGLILAAGRGTHARAYSLKKHLGLPAVALMDPGWLRRRRFDLCVIPRHDGVTESSSVIVTEGVLNAITPAQNALSTEALLLIGGPSRHYDWEDESVLTQLRALLAREPGMNWTVSGSRRTPASTDKMLRGLASEYGGRFTYTPASQTPPGWVGEQLQRCGVCWVSEDSVSMVYEALTAGARVGLLDVPQRSSKPGRVGRGVLSLVDRGWVAEFDDWRDGGQLPAGRPPLAEADRVAGLLIERWRNDWL